MYPLTVAGDVVTAEGGVSPASSELRWRDRETLWETEADEGVTLAWSIWLEESY